MQTVLVLQSHLLLQRTQDASEAAGETTATASSTCRYIKAPVYFEPMALSRSVTAGFVPLKESYD